jgi:hypothetical protein
MMLLMLKTLTTIKPRLENRESGGRPPKFDEPSRPITLTLPERTLKGLERIDADRGRAIVKLTNAALREGNDDPRQVDIVQVADKTGLLIIGPCEALRRISFLHLVEVAPGRYLLALDSGNDFRGLELAVQDVLADLPQSELRERELITELLDHIRKLRKAELVSMAEILFVRMEDKRRK